MIQLIGYGLWKKAMRFNVKLHAIGPPRCAIGGSLIRVSVDWWH